MPLLHRHLNLSGGVLVIQAPAQLHRVETLLLGKLLHLRIEILGVDFALVLVDPIVVIPEGRLVAVIHAAAGDGRFHGPGMNGGERKANMKNGGLIGYRWLLMVTDGDHRRTNGYRKP